MLIGLYPRVSTTEQAENGHSIEEQTERMEKYCEAMGWTVYKTYTDAGYSGANTDRPALQRMIRDVKAGKIDKVLVYKLDRLSRSQKDTLLLIEDVFLANNVDFVSMSENFDTSTPFGRAIIGILAVFAQLEREQIKERMSMGRYARAKEGKFHGSCRVPIGYDYIKEIGQLVTNDFEKLQIQKLYEMYAAGVSPYKIAEELNAAGMHHKYGEWRHKTIRDILPKKTYLGYTFFNGEWYQGEHEPFIDQELYDKCQEIRKQKSEEHAKHNRRSGKATSLLGGYICCAQCTAKYGKVAQKRKRKDGSYNINSYYICNSRNKRSKEQIKDPNCKNKNWRESELNDLVFAEIKKLALDPDYIAEIKASQKEDERPSIINAEINKLDEQLSRLMDAYTVGGMPLEILQDKIHALNDRKLKLEAEIAEINKEHDEKLSQAETLQIAQSFGDILDRGDFDEIRTEIGALIEQIEIDEDLVTIHWTFA